MLDSIIMKQTEKNPPSLSPQKRRKLYANPKTKARNLLDGFVQYKDKTI
jgi:transposase